ncbi:hypothetical protein SprV_0200944000 [Sparganum proliferum]
MGSPLGPFLANVFMGKVEMTTLQDTINDLNFYGRYVDDIFCLTDVATDTDALVQKFNNAHPSLTFSAEFQADNEIAFFDLLLHRQEDGSIQRRSWTRALDDRHEVHIAFIDFQKAFDTVPRQRLLHKLKKIGIGGNFLKWIENFLLGRHQVVCIGQGKSDPAMVGSGVPQGSVLGPILFLIYVDDAARALDCEVALFADDMKIWSVIRGPADEDILQVNLNRLEEWSNRWLLRFNVEFAYLLGGFLCCCAWASRLVREPKNGRHR